MSADRLASASCTPLLLSQLALDTRVSCAYVVSR